MVFSLVSLHLSWTRGIFGVNVYQPMRWTCSTCHRVLATCHGWTCIPLLHVKPLLLHVTATTCHEYIWVREWSAKQYPSVMYFTEEILPSFSNRTSLKHRTPRSVMGRVVRCLSNFSDSIIESSCYIQSYHGSINFPGPSLLNSPADQVHLGPLAAGESKTCTVFYAVSGWNADGPWLTNWFTTGDCNCVSLAVKHGRW